jgi:hypothetical protein
VQPTGQLGEPIYQGAVESDTREENPTMMSSERQSAKLAVARSVLSSCLAPVFAPLRSARCLWVLTQGAEVLDALMPGSRMPL